MRRILLLFVTLCLATQASAGIIPKLKLGVKAGFDYQSNNFSTDLANFELPSGAGWFAGVQGDLSWGGFGVHPEVLFSHNAFNVKTFNSKIKLNKIDIPLLLQYRLFGILALQAGPTFCVMTSTDGEIGGIKWDINRPTVGYAAGFEVKVWKLAVSARYNGAFKRSEVLGYSTGKNKIDTIQIGVGYYF